MIKLLIGGDVCPINRNEPYFIAGDARTIFNDLLDVFNETDLSIVNLECPLVDKESPIKKIGPNLRAPSDCIKGIERAKIDVVNLANNHIMDHGPNGLLSTLESCKDAEIATVGAGINLLEARRILVRKVNDLKVGILGVAEHEFSIATHNRPGANPLDLIDYFRNVKSNEKNFDYLIVLVHGGNEHYPLPSPRLKKVCRFFVEMGANAVIVQHTHCSGCYEEYKNSFIVYGQGNLIFDLPKRGKAFYEGFLIELSIDSDLGPKMRIIPYVQSFSQHGAKKMNREEEHNFLKRIKERSNAIKDNAFVKDQWLKFCKKNKAAYISRIYGLNFFFTKLIYRNLFVKFFLNSRSLNRLQNTISCESHREVLETLLNSRML